MRINVKYNKLFHDDDEVRSKVEMVNHPNNSEEQQKNHKTSKV